MQLPIKVAIKRAIVIAHASKETQNKERRNAACQFLKQYLPRRHSGLVLSF